MRNQLPIVILLALSCTAKDIGRDVLTTASLMIPAGCMPDDGLDDASCIQTAMDAACAAGGGTVHLATGTWDLKRPANVAGNRDNASLWMECSDLALEGEGPATVLAMTGDGLGADWTAVRLSADPLGTPIERISVSNLTIQSDAAYNINEQTHLLMLGSTANAPGAISNVQIHHLRLRHPVRPEIAGDCLRFVGEDTAPITFVDVGSVVFEACDRSGVAVQRGVRDVNLHDLMFVNVGKTGIDMEPSGMGEIARFEIRHCHFANSGITIAGQSSAWTRQIILASSYIGGRLGVIYARDVTIANNVIAEVAVASEGTLNVRATERLVFAGNQVRRLAGSAAGAAVKISGTNGNYPTGLVLSDNTITSEIGGTVIDVESVQDMTLSGNLITGNDPTGVGVAVRATGRDISGLVLTGNRFRGTLLYAIRLSGYPANVVGALVSGNYSSGVTGAGLRCENSLKFTAPLVHGGYYYQGASGAVSGCTGVTIATQSP